MSSDVNPPVERYEKCIQTSDITESSVVRIPSELSEKQDKPVASRIQQTTTQEQVPKNTITAIKKSNDKNDCSL